MAKRLRAQRKKVESVSRNEPSKARESKPIPQSYQESPLDNADLQPDASLSTSVTRLQRTIGNRAVGRLGSTAGPEQRPNRDGRPSDTHGSLKAILRNSAAIIDKALGQARPTIQAKLTVGPVGDKYEKEADQVAQQVVGRLSGQQPGGQPGVQRQEEEELAQMQTVSAHRPAISTLQRQEEEEVMMKPAAALQRQKEEEELQAKPISTVQRQEEEELQAKLAPILQRQEEEEEMVQPKSTAEGGPVTSDIENTIQGARGGGQALADSVRSSMEQAFGADFGGVRVHSDSQSNALNQSIQARAFTTGQDIFFRQGEYNPGSSDGQELLAHELTHVVQQTGAQSPDIQASRSNSETIQRWPAFDDRVNGDAERNNLFAVIAKDWCARNGKEAPQHPSAENYFTKPADTPNVQMHHAIKYFWYRPTRHKAKKGLAKGMDWTKEGLETGAGFIAGQGAEDLGPIAEVLFEGGGKYESVSSGKKSMKPSGLHRALGSLLWNIEKKHYLKKGGAKGRSIERYIEEKKLLRHRKEYSVVAVVIRTLWINNNRSHFQQRFMVGKLEGKASADVKGVMPPWAGQPEEGSINWMPQGSYLLSLGNDNNWDSGPDPVANVPEQDNYYLKWNK